jgi:hypothetical protein
MQNAELVIVIASGTYNYRLLLKDKLELVQCRQQLHLLNVHKTICIRRTRVKDDLFCLCNSFPVHLPRFISIMITDVIRNPLDL